MSSARTNAASYTVKLPARTCTCRVRTPTAPLSLKGAAGQLLPCCPLNPSYAENLYISEIDEATETDLCKPLQAVLHLGKGGRKKGHAWRLVNIGRIMAKWGRFYFGFFWCVPVPDRIFWPWAQTMNANTFFFIKCQPIAWISLKCNTMKKQW